MINSVQVIGVSVRMHHPKSYESIPNIERLLYPIITYSVPGKKPRKISYSACGPNNFPNSIRDDIKKYTIGRSTIALTYSETQTLELVTDKVMAKVRKKMRAATTRKDFNRSFQQYLKSSRKLDFIAEFRDLLERHSDVTNLREIEKIFTEVKNRKVVQSVMET